MDLGEIRSLIELTFFLVEENIINTEKRAKNYSKFLLMQLHLFLPSVAGFLPRLHLSVSNSPFSSHPRAFELAMPWSKHSIHLSPNLPT